MLVLMYFRNDHGVLSSVIVITITVLTVVNTYLHLFSHEDLFKKWMQCSLCFLSKMILPVTAAREKIYGHFSEITTFEDN